MRGLWLVVLGVVVVIALAVYQSQFPIQYKKVLSYTSMLAHRSGCHRWHSCPSDTGSYICGDLGHPCQYPTYSESNGETDYSSNVPIVPKQSPTPTSYQQQFPQSSSNQSSQSTNEDGDHASLGIFLAFVVAGIIIMFSRQVK